MSINVLCFVPRESRGERLGGQQASSSHPFREAMKRSLIGVKGSVEAVVSWRALGSSRPEGGRQAIPEEKRTGIEMIQVSADIARLPAIQIEAGLQRVAISASFITLEQSEGNKRIEEIACAAIGNINLHSERVGPEWFVG